MSAEVLGAGPMEAIDLQTAKRRAQIFRLAFGMTFSAGIAFALAWPLSYITPLVAAKLLTLPKALSLKAGLVLVVLTGGSLFLSARVLLPTLAYPAVHLLLTALILFLLFYAKAGGTNPVLVVLLLLGTLAVPLIGTVSEDLAREVTKGLVFDIAVAVAMVFVATVAFPDPHVPPPGATSRQGASAEQAEPDAVPAARVRVALALRSLVVIYPLAVVFQLFSLVSFAVVLIMASLLSMEPTFGKHLGAGKGLVLANLAGGLVAVVIYQLLVMVPSFTFFLLLVLLAGLWVGGWIFSERLLGKLLGGGITAVFIILGPAVTGDAQAGAQLFVRLAMIMGAVIYVVLAFGLLERLTRGRRRVA